MLLRSISLMMALNLLKAAVTLLLSFLITRFVPPSEFGLIAFSLPFVALLTLLTDLGIANAILRERNLSRQQAGATVSLMIGLGVVAALVLASSAHWLEISSKVIGVTHVLYGFAIVTCFQIWATAPRALLEREQAYGKVTKNEGLALAIALIVFLLGLMLHAGVFALVFYHMALQTVRALLFLLSTRKSFDFVLVPKGIKSLIHAGGWIFLSNMLSYASRNFDKFIVGSHLGQTALGLYGFAYQFMTIPLVLLAWPASNVLMSSLTRVADNPILKRDVIRAFVSLTALIAIPLVTYISLLLEYPLSHYLSNKWSGVSHYIALLTPIGALQAIAVYASSVLVSNGQFKTNFSLGLLNGILVPLVMFVSVSFGLSIFIISYVAAWFVVSALMIYFMCKASDISMAMFFNTLQPGLIAGAVATVIAWIFSLGNYLTLSGWLMGSLGFFLGSCLALFLCRNQISFFINMLKLSRT